MQDEEALRTMELWMKILPDDEDIRAGLYLVKVACARTQSEIEKEIREIRKKIGTPMKNPLPVNGKKDAPDEEQDKNNKKEKPGLQVYKKALTKAWRRLGYPAELASLRTEIICTDEESELECWQSRCAAV